MSSLYVSPLSVATPRTVRGCSCESCCIRHWTRAPRYLRDDSTEAMMPRYNLIRLYGQSRAAVRSKDTTRQFYIDGTNGTKPTACPLHESTLTLMVFGIPARCRTRRHNFALHTGRTHTTCHRTRLRKRYTRHQKSLEEEDDSEDDDHSYTRSSSSG